MLSFILRSCPNVEMIGVYECPLIHCGDIPCLLDLIHEIKNRQRRREGLLLIKAFDFFPRYHGGMPFEDSRAATYGLTWSANSLETVQRGFFVIVLKAFMKARAMKLDLLFTKGKAFCDFLYHVPNYTLAIASFLDALHRYVELKDCKNPSESELKQAIYDLLKPVRLGLENVEDDWPHWYLQSMGKNPLFCSSCGYEMLRQFFTRLSRASPSLSLPCAGCLLQHQLDMETDHLKGEKKRALGLLFPAHDRLQFNQDTPLCQGARGLIRLASTRTKQSAPPLSLSNSGNVYQLGYQEIPVRDNKIHFDSLQGLPGLGELVQGATFATKWAAAMDLCHQMDMVSRVVRRLRDESRGTKGSLCERMIDGGMPDHAEERQHPRVSRDPTERLSHNFLTVVKLEKYIYDKGWL